MKSFFLVGALLVSSCCALAAPDAKPPISPATHPALTDFPLSQAPYLGAYRWGAANPNGGAKANEAYSRWINRPVVWAEDFEAIEAWDNNIDGGSWQLGEWRDWKKSDPKKRRLVLSVPLLPGGWDRSGAKHGTGAGQAVSFDAGAKGDYNAHFKTLAQNLVDYGLGDSVLRLGWEFNGGWYTWRASDNPAGFAAYWRQIVTTMRAVKGAEKLQFCWNPALGWQQFPAEQAYPGDDYVDIVGLDVYDESWGQDTYPIPEGATKEEIEKRRDRAWNEVIFGGNMGIKWWSDFARKHGKLLAFPEWSISKREDGHGGLDNPKFVERMHEFINDPKNNVYFSCHFDVQAGDGHHQLSPGLSGDETNEFAVSAARFRQLFAQQDAAIPGQGTGLSATFFGDKTLSIPVATAQVPTVDFDFHAGRAPSGTIRTPAARFNGQVQALEGGVYSFRIMSNGQARLWVNDALLFDRANSSKAALINLVGEYIYPKAVVKSIDVSDRNVTIVATVATPDDFVQFLLHLRNAKGVVFAEEAKFATSGVGGWSKGTSRQVAPKPQADKRPIVINHPITITAKAKLLHPILATNGNNAITLVAGQQYPIKAEFIAVTKGKLEWKRPGRTAFETVPARQLYPQMGNGTGLQAAYFQGANFEMLATTRTDSKVDFWWGEGGPSASDGKAMGNIGTDKFSVRWTGQLQALESGSYTFSTSTDDGARLWVNGKLVIDHWISGPQSTNSATVTLQAGRKYALKMEYFDDTQSAVARLSWTRPGQGTSQIVPTSQLFPAP